MKVGGEHIREETVQKWAAHRGWSWGKTQEAKAGWTQEWGMKESTDKEGYIHSLREGRVHQYTNVCRVKDRSLTERERGARTHSGFIMWLKILFYPSSNSSPISSGLQGACKVLLVFFDVCGALLLYLCFLLWTEVNLTAVYMVKNVWWMDNRQKRMKQWEVQNNLCIICSWWKQIE